MEFTWTDYKKDNAVMVDSWLDADTVAMTGLDKGWDAYWNAVLADAVNFPGCKDARKLVWEGDRPIGVICFGCYEGVATVSEIVVAPQYRGRGYGTRILQELIARMEEFLGERPTSFTAVIFPENRASQRAFEKAGFALDCAHEDRWTIRISETEGAEYAGTAGKSA